MATSEDEGKFEKLLAKCGNEGLYQNLLVGLFVVPLNFMLPWAALGPILLSAVPKHWCDVPGRPDNVSVDLWMNTTIPRKEDGSFEECLQYEDGTKNIINCTGSFAYSKDLYDRTLATHRNWVCADAASVANWLAVGLVGNIFGTLCFNSLSDLYGRRPIFVVTVMIHAAMGVARVYVEPYWLLIVTQFIASMAFPAMLEIHLILVYEFMSSRWRSKVTGSSFILWSLGLSFLALCGYLCRSDQLLGLLTSLPFLVYVFTYRWIPESPRWLLARGRIREAYSLLSKVARVNSVEEPQDLLESLTDGILEISMDKQPHYGVLQLLQTPRLRTRTLLITACYTLNNIFYYGLAYNLTNMVGNDFLNFFILGITEIPSSVFGWWSSINIGRRWTQTSSFLFASVFLSLLLLVGESPAEWLNLTLLTISKLFITTGFQMMYLQAGEIFPTTHCATGLGLASIVSSAVGVTVPYIAYSRGTAWWLPYLTLVILGYLGCLVASFVPETLNSPIPQSLKDAEEFSVDVPYWSYRGRRFWERRRGEPLINNSQR